MNTGIFRMCLHRLIAFAVIVSSTVTVAPVHAQSLTVAYAPGCGYSKACTTARFSITAGSAGLSVNSLALTLTNTAYRFFPNVTTGSAVGTFVASDDYGPFGGFSSITNSGRDWFADFINTGDPSNPGFPLSLGSGSTAYLEVNVNVIGQPTTPPGPLYVTFRANTGDEGFVTGAFAPPPPSPPSTTVPEPSTTLLAGAGIAVLLAWRRRSAATGVR